jgi:glycine oxidase
MSEKSRQTAEVVIIGGGVIGLSIARALALRGVRGVAVIERSSFGCEASSAAAGMLAPQAEADRTDEFFSLCCQSRDGYPDFADNLREETGIDIELDKTGTLYVALNAADQKEIEHRFEWQTAAGLSVEKLTSVEARVLEPCISEYASGALRFPKDIQVENRKLISALVEANKKTGVQLFSGTTVSSIKTLRGVVNGVETLDGFLDTRKVVLAAGAWTSMLLPTDKAQSRIGIEPVRGQMVCFETNPRLTGHVIYSPRGYIVPRMDGRLLAGSTSEMAGFNKSTTGAGVHSILARTLEITASLANLPIIATWAGLRPRAPDGLPVLGPCAEIEGLFYATGHYRNGILLAPITGQLMADVIVAKPIPPLIKTFTPDRFQPVSVF